MKELFNQDLRELISFAMKLFLHCVELVIVLTFVFVVGWIDRYFRRVYSNMDSTLREDLIAHSRRQPWNQIRRTTTRDKRGLKAKGLRQTGRSSRLPKTLPGTGLSTKRPAK